MLYYLKEKFLVSVKIYLAAIFLVNYKKNLSNKSKCDCLLADNTANYRF